MNKFKFFLLVAITLNSVISLDALAINKSRKAPEVGEVTSLTSGNLYIKDTRKKDNLIDLHQNDKLQLGDKVIAGDGAKATLNFSRPKGVSKDTELIFIQPKPGEEYTVNVKLESNEDGSIEATINP